MSNRFHVGTRKGLFTVKRNGAGWAVTGASFLGENCPMLLPDRRDGSLYVAVKHEHYGQKLHRSTDGGASWSELTTPAFPPKPEGATDEVNAAGQVIPWDLKMIWSLEAGGPDQPDTLWAGTLPGGLFRSDDRGASWRLVESLWNRPERSQWMGGGYDWPGIHSICVDPRDSRRVTLGVSCGGVWCTDDGGDTWACRADGMLADYMPPELRGDPNVQDPHRVVQCAAAPDYLWAQHHCGIFRTTDGCASWSPVPDVQPSAFGFAVAVHPRDGQTAWFVPAVKDATRIPVDGRVVVTRTRDGGATFDALTRGLPQSHAYDIAYRHALEVDDTGDTLAMGTTTGNLWVSEDAGDSWQTVSTHLPPIYCVRF